MSDTHPSVQNLLNFKNKTVLVTGASGGIGQVTAKRFAEAGAKVIVHYNSNKKSADECVQEITQNGGDAFAMQARLDDEGEVSAMFAEVFKDNDKLGVLINNAGGFPNKDFLSMSISEWRDMFASNLDSAVLCSQNAGRHMKNNGGGAIVNISSIAALSPGPDHSHYNSAKAAMLMMTKSAAQELGPFGVRVNAVSPGVVYREGLEDVWPEGLERWSSKAPLGGLGTALDVADACLFLASPAARYITGSNIPVEGGMMAASIY